MANNERLTKRVRKMEEWIAENEGGPTLTSFVYLVDALKNTSDRLQECERAFNNQRNLMGQYFTEKETMEDWNEWLQEQEKNKDAVQKQQTEEVSVQEEAEGGEEAIKASEEKKE
jgi:hypothetical protein